MSSITADAGTKRKFPGLGQAQRVGRSLMLPIAALPAAGLLLRLGQPDLLGGIPGFETGGAVIASAGGALFGALPLLFAVGVAIGFAKKADGSTALAAVVGYLVFSKVGEAMSPLVLGLPEKGGTQDLVNYSVLGGILMGIVSALLWQKYHRISLPSYLAFFGGRRFVPIITAVVALVLGVLLSFVYPAFANGLTGFGEIVTSNDIWGGFLYGTTNRLLIPVGLHHILNSVVWFVIGDYNGATGDLGRFFAGDPTAGSFMTGFFPIMMFALPAGALAIWHEAKPSQKKIVGGIMLSGALTAMLTGVTEPLEFSLSPSRSNSPSCSSRSRCSSSTRCSPDPRSPWSTPSASGMDSASAQEPSTTCSTSGSPRSRSGSSRSGWPTRWSTTSSSASSSASGT